MNLSLAVCLSASAWAVMMDRRQQRLLLVLLPPALFVPAHQDETGPQRSLEALGDDTQPFIIYEETSDIWVNVRGNTLTDMFVCFVCFLRFGLQRCLCLPGPRHLSPIHPNTG